MPKETFYRIKPERREAITQAFLHEFSHQLYDDASITSVVKSLGIAKGSIYQYFEDKLDLFLYLKEQSELTKMEYIMHIKRDDHADFWDYYRTLYSEGIKFDEEHPLKSRLLYTISTNVHSPSLKDMLESWKQKALVLMESMIQAEIDAGHFRKDVPLKSMAFFLYTISVSLGEYMQSIHDVRFDPMTDSDEPILAGNKELILQSIDEYILLLRNAFNTCEQ